VVFSTNKNDRHDITEALLKVALNTITITLTFFFVGEEEGVNCTSDTTS
jgi:hypothetical protein